MAGSPVAVPLLGKTLHLLMISALQPPFLLKFVTNAVTSATTAAILIVFYSQCCRCRYYPRHSHGFLQIMLSFLPQIGATRITGGSPEGYKPVLPGLSVSPDKPGKTGLSHKNKSSRIRKGG